MVTLMSVHFLHIVSSVKIKYIDQALSHRVNSVAQDLSHFSGMHIFSLMKMLF